MSERRVLVPEFDFSLSQAGERFVMTREFSHYIERVLRIKMGTTIELCDGKQHCWSAQVLSEEDGQISCVLQDKLPVKSRPYPIFLAQSLPKGDKFDLILRQGTELGISGFFPFFSERSIVRLDEKKRLRRLDRWRKITREAARQSGRDQIPFVEMPVSFNDLFPLLPPHLPYLLCWEEAQGYPLKQWLQEQRQPPQGIVIIVGPEGGFSSKEVKKSELDGAIPVGLGSLILRTETAGNSVASILQFTFGLLGGDKPLK